MRHFTGFLAVFATLFGLAGARADTLVQYLTFRTKDQSLWNGGANRSYDFNLIGTWGNYSFDESASTKIPTLGHFSAGATGGVDAGSAELIATAYANSGSVNVTYPMTLTLNYPNPGTLSPSQTFTVSYSWAPGTPTAAPSLVAKSPTFGVKINGVLEEPNIHLGISGRAFGKWIFRDTLFSQSVHFNDTLVDTKDVTPGDRDLFNGILSVAYKQPKINLTGNLVPTSGALHAYGDAGSADRSGTGFFTLNGNFSNVISRIAKIPKFTDTIHESGFGCRFNGGYDIVSLIGSAGVGLEEEVQFHPNPQVTLVVNEGNGNNRRVVTIPAGGAIQLTMPADGTLLSIDPYVSLDNSFDSRVSAYASAALKFYPFDITCALSLPGYTLPTLDYAIAPINIANVRSRFGDVYHETFKLGGFDDLFLPRIKLVPTANPTPTPLVANDDFYQAGLSGGAYTLFAGFGGSSPNPLTNDSGPTGFHAVAQHWQPDPLDPDTYFNIDTFGHVTFSMSQAVVTRQGIGLSQFQYQITDDHGHFATANINITLGGGG